MKAIEIEYDEDSGRIEAKEGAVEKDWVRLCRDFNDDVHRIGDVSDQGEYTAVYACFDENECKFYYLVEERKDLYRIKRSTFLGKLGLKKDT